MAAVNPRALLGLEDDIGPAFTGDDFPYRGALIAKSFWTVVAIPELPKASAVHAPRRIDFRTGRIGDHP